MSEPPRGEDQPVGSQQAAGQRVRDQSSLTTSTGRIWLIVGGLLTIICGGFLFAMQWLVLPTVALTGLILVLAFYAAMFVVRFSVHPGRVRLTLLMALTLAIILSFFVCAGIITATLVTDVQ
jgi:hypothetical protein